MYNETLAAIPDYQGNGTSSTTIPTGFCSSVVSPPFLSFLSLYSSCNMSSKGKTKENENKRADWARAGK